MGLKQHVCQLGETCTGRPAWRDLHGWLAGQGRSGGWLRLARGAGERTAFASGERWWADEAWLLHGT